MKRSAALALLFLAGCSTAPLADLMDFFSPGRLAAPTVAPYGGVCNPQPLIPPPVGSIPAPAPAPILAAPVAPVPGPPVAPPPSAGILPPTPPPVPVPPPVAGPRPPPVPPEGI